MKQTIETVINLIAAFAITAPKAGGKNCLEIVAITEADDLKKLLMKCVVMLIKVVSKTISYVMLLMPNKPKACY